MSEYRNADGLVLISARIRDERLREEFWHHLEDLPGERVNRATYEFSVVDWDEGLWDEEVEWISDLLAGTGESVVIWRFLGGRYCRFRLGSH
jgi:hypothetical protein